MLDAEFTQILQSWQAGHEPCLAEAERLCSASAPELEQILQNAKQIRFKYFSNRVYLRALIEFSNHCSCACKYCGLNVNNQELERYAMTPQQVLEIAGEANKIGFKTIVLQSGEDLSYPTDQILEIIYGIKKIGDIAITLSLGQRTFDELKAFKQAGADRYLLKHETALPNLYKALHPDSCLEDRVKYYPYLHELGYQVGGGFMVGLPPWDNKALAKNLMLLKEHNIQMAGIGPFLPSPNTPLAKAEPGSAEETIKAIALARLLLPKALLPATTSLEVSASGKRLLALEYGANVLMPQATPTNYRQLYQIYPKPVQELTLLEQKNNLNKILTNYGFTIATDRGDYHTT